MTRIKMCGIMREEDVQTVNQIRPYYCGFVFARESPRFVSPKTASMLIRGLSRGITPVGVFRNADAVTIADYSRISGVKMVQVHGDYADADILAIKESTRLPVIQAFSMSAGADMDAVRRSVADLVLLDSGLGGTGERFSAPSLDSVGRDFILAGGLDPENATDAVKQFRPFAVDVSTGIETDGLKNPVKMRAFADAVRRADYEIEESE